MRMRARRRCSSQAVVNVFESHRFFRFLWAPLMVPAFMLA